MRTRQNNQTEYGTVHYALSNDVPLPSSLTSYAPVQKLVYCKKERCEDEVTPMYKRRSAKGEIIMNPLLLVKGELESPMTPYTYQYEQWRQSDNSLLMRKHWVYYSNGQPESFADGASWALTPAINTAEFETRKSWYPSIDTSGMKSRTLTRALADAGSAEVLGLVSLAELNKTCESLQRLYTLVPRFREWLLKRSRKDLTKRGLIRRGLEAGSQWLEYRYGFMQIYYDVTSWYTAFARDGKYRVRFVATERDSSDVVTATENSTYTYSTQVKTLSRRTSVEVQSGVLVGIKPTSAIEQLFVDAGINKLATSSWELIPFSFVVDWIINVGETIAAWEGNFYRPVLGSWRTVRTTYTGTQRRVYEGRDYYSGGYRYVGFYNHTAETTEVVHHTVREANPTPDVLPSLQIKMNWKKWTDAVALLAQLRREVLLRIR